MGNGNHKDRESGIRTRARSSEKLGQKGVQQVVPKRWQWDQQGGEVHRYLPLAESEASSTVGSIYYREVRWVDTADLGIILTL